MAGDIPINYINDSKRHKSPSVMSKSPHHFQQDVDLEDEIITEKNMQNYRNFENKNEFEEKKQPEVLLEPVLTDVASSQLLRRLYPVSILRRNIIHKSKQSGADDNGVPYSSTLTAHASDFLGRETSA